MEWEEVRLVEIGAKTFRLSKNSKGQWKSEPLPTPSQEEPTPPTRERRLLGIFTSKSSPKDKHYVYLEPDRELTCTCWGFRSPNKCWHYRGMKEVLKEKPAHLITEPIRR